MFYSPFFLLLFLSLLLSGLGCAKVAQGSSSSSLAPAQVQGQWAAKPKVILDADTANEIDDLFAIARLLADTNVNLLGINSAQWFHLWSGDSTVYQSQSLNEELVAVAGRTDIPLPLGADLIMGKPWGDYDPRPSPAADFIIAQVKALPPGEKLAVLCIGAATNLASAIAMDSSITQHLVAYMLGFQYNFEQGYWNKDEFNIRRDLNAANFLLNQPDLELHIMPISVAKTYTWQQADTFSRLAKMGPMGHYLREKWLARFADANTWVMWDVALLQAFLLPSLASELVVATPPENTPRQVFIYNRIDATAMYEDYWNMTGR